MLSPKVTLPLAAFYFTIMCSVLAVHYVAQGRDAYPVHNVNLYLVARYGPAVTAVITTQCFRSTVQHLLRMLPYINMADQRRGRLGTYGSISVGTLYSRVLSRANTPSTWSIRLLMLVTTALISYKTLLVHISVIEGTFYVSIRTGVALVLTVYYALIGCFTLCVTYALWDCETGLRENWDPRSLADIIAIFRWVDWNPAYVDGSFQDANSNLRRTTFRLGYWRRGHDEVLYGVRLISQSAPGSHHDPDKYRCRHSPLISKFFLTFWTTIAVILLGLLIYAAVAGHVTNGFAVKGLAVVAMESVNGFETANLTLSGPDRAIPAWTPSLKANVALVLSGYYRLSTLAGL